MHTGGEGIVVSKMSDESRITCVAVWPCGRRVWLPKMTAAFPASTASEFHGLTIPEGVEKRILYHSSFRAIATYAMSLADLDREIQHMVHTRRGVIKEDARRNLGGKRACLF